MNREKMNCRICGRQDARIRLCELNTARITGRAHVDCHGHSEYRSVTVAEIDLASDCEAYKPKKVRCEVNEERINEVNSTDLLGVILCPECGSKVAPPDPCEVCGYEHQCGGPAEACCIPGCSECGTPNAHLSGGTLSAQSDCSQEAGNA